MSEATTRPSLVILAALFMIAVPLAGCLGGGGGLPTGDDGPPGQDGEETGPDGGPPEGGETEAGRQQHVHDRWFEGPNQQEGPETDVIELIGGTFTIDSVDESNPNQPVHRCRGGSFWLCYGDVIVPPREEEVGTRIVPPGTTNVTITVDMEKDNYRGVGVYYQDPSVRGTGAWKGLGEATEFPTTFRVPVSLNNDSTAEPDNGHAAVSQWRVLLEILGNPAPYPVTTPYVTEPTGKDVEVTVEALNEDGELPLEPPHPTFYDEASPPTDVYQLSEISGSTEGRFVQLGPSYGEMGPNACTGEIQGQCLPARFGSGLAWITKPGFTSDRFAEGREPDWAPINESHVAPLVPPKTKILTAHVSFSDNVEVQGNVELCLRTRTSPTQPQVGEERACEPVTSQTGSLAFSIPIDDLWDSYYANNWKDNASRYLFFLQLRSQDTGQQVDVYSMHEPGAFQGGFDAVVLASSKTSLDEMPGWLEG